MALLEVENLRKLFPVRKGFFQRTAAHVHAVEGVSFQLERGETLGLVGESGCGKTTVGRMLLRLIDPTSGSIHFEGNDLSQFDPAALRAWRKRAQMIFQDPFSSLNPRMRIRDIVAEGLVIHGQGSEISSQVESLLETVGLGSEALRRFPHEFSGGQRQRIAIARALALNPTFLVADEPVSALDVSIQAQIVNLLVDLQKSRKLAFLFVSHDLRLVEFIAHKVAVMYLGRIMELMPAQDLHEMAAHPYSRALLSAVPVLDPKDKKKRTILTGDVPSPIDPPSGCVFHTRCPLAEPKCKSEIPTLRPLDSKHSVACHLV